MLCEPGVRRMLGITLRACTARRNKHYSLLFNLTVGILGLATAGVWLYARYKGRKSRAQTREEAQLNHRRVIEKLRMYSAARRGSEAGREITGLPRWDQLNS